MEFNKLGEKPSLYSLIPTRLIVTVKNIPTLFYRHQFFFTKIPILCEKHIMYVHEGWLSILQKKNQLNDHAILFVDI